jgi:hypothetical protein
MPEAARLAEPPNGCRTAHARFSRRRPGDAVAALQTGQRLLGSALSQSGIAHRQARLIPRHMSSHPEYMHVHRRLSARYRRCLLSRPARRLDPHRFPSSCRFTSHRCLMQSGWGSSRLGGLDTATRAWSTPAHSR